MPGGGLIITGATGEIGASIALAASTEGRAVCVNYRSDAHAAGELVGEIEAVGGRAIAVEADVTDPAQVRLMFERTAHAFGTVDGLVNNAGIIGGLSRVEQLDPARLRQVLDVNVAGPFICCAEAVRWMSSAHGWTGGSIVNVSSRAASLGGAHEWVHYAASKGAVDSLTIGLARELAGEGIRVNAVNPGLIDTRIHAQAGDPGRLERLVGSVPMGRPGRVSEVAAAVVFLLSSRASYITGTTLDVSGGR